MQVRCTFSNTTRYVKDRIYECKTYNDFGVYGLTDEYGKYDECYSWKCTGIRFEPIDVLDFNKQQLELIWKCVNEELSKVDKINAICGLNGSGEEYYKRLRDVQDKIEKLIGFKNK